MPHLEPWGGGTALSEHNHASDPDTAEEYRTEPK